MTTAVRTFDEITTATLLELVRAGTLAPSSHNSQPWRFELGEREIDVYADRSRRLPIADGDEHELYASIGCAIENIVLAAGARGLAARVTYTDEERDAHAVAPLVATIELAEARRPRSAPLAHAIPHRQTTRGPYDGRAIVPAHLQLLEAAGGGRERVRLLTDALDVEMAIELVEDASKVVFADRGYVREILSWLRFTPSDAGARRDGISAPALGLRWMPTWLGRLAVRLGARPLREATSAAALIRSSAALAIFATEDDTRAGWMEVGRDFQRFALQATALGIRHAHVNVACEVASVRERLRQRFALGRARPMLLVRLGYAHLMPRSYRRELQNVVIVRPRRPA